MQRVVVLTLLATFVAGITQAAGATAAVSPALAGTWQLTKLRGAEPSVPGITASFTAAGKLSGFSGCNRYSGRYTTSASKITISDLAMPLMACPEPAMRTESAYVDALESAKRYSVESGTLTLKGRLGRTLLTFAVQSQSLAGTSWNVTGYNNGKQAVVSVLAGTKLTAEFGKDGGLSGSAGCNSYSGPVKATPPKITIGPLGSTKKSCPTPEGVMTQEAAYLAALESAATYRLEGRKLELRTEGGAIAVTLQQA
jgi:heat shock protein HslJ